MELDVHKINNELADGLTSIHLIVTENEISDKLRKRLKDLEGVFKNIDLIIRSYRESKGNETFAVRPSFVSKELNKNIV